MTVDFTSFKEDVAAALVANMDSVSWMANTGLEDVALHQLMAPARSLLSEGKRTRATLVLAGYSCAFSGASPAAIHAGAAMELYQASALVHDDVVDRSALAQIVFHDDDALAQLSAITHPRTWELIDERLAQVEAEDRTAVAVVDLALLVGSGREWAYQLNLVVDANPETRIRRLTSYRKMNERDARARMATQVETTHLEAVSDVWIENSGSASGLRNKVEELWQARLVPFAANLAAGERAIGSSLKPTQLEMNHAIARLRHQRIEASLEGQDLAFTPLATVQATEEAFRRAGFLPEEGHFVSADPAFNLTAQAA